MAKDKKSFVLYCDLIHTVELLDDDLAGKLFKHLLKYVNDENPETDNMVLKIAFEPIKRQLKRDLKDWEDKRQNRIKAGHIGGIKSSESRRLKQKKANEASDSKSKQPKANEAVNVNVNVNDNVTDTVNINNLITEEQWVNIKKKWNDDFRWKEKICRDKKIEMPDLQKKIDIFISERELKDDYKFIPALKSHFINWYNKNSNGNNNHKTVGKTMEFDRP